MLLAQSKRGPWSFTPLAPYSRTRRTSIGHRGRGLGLGGTPALARLGGFRGLGRSRRRGRGGRSHGLGRGRGRRRVRRRGRGGRRRSGSTREIEPALVLHAALGE